MMMGILRFSATAAFVVTLGTTTNIGQDNPLRNVWEGVFSAEQAERGMVLAENHCAMCHASNLRGSPGAPAIAGVEFLFIWNNETAGELHDYIKTNMPPGTPGGLRDQEYADIVAAIFESSGFPATRETELPGNVETLANIQILRQEP
jgi:mono/diheme cytochrome c family protein